MVSHNLSAICRQIVWVFDHFLGLPLKWLMVVLWFFTLVSNIYDSKESMQYQSQSTFLWHNQTRAIAPKKCMTLCYYHITYEFQSESTVYSLPKCQGTSSSKQALYLKFKWQQRDSNPQPLSSETKTQQFTQTGRWLSVRPRTKWLWVRITLLSLKNMYVCG